MCALQMRSRRKCPNSARTRTPLELEDEAPLASRTARGAFVVVRSLRGVATAEQYSRGRMCNLWARAKKLYRTE
jgi:hypothetical protein